MANRWGNSDRLYILGSKITADGHCSHEIKRRLLLGRKVMTNLQFNSVAQSCPTLCDPMNCSTPGLPVHHQLPEFTQTHVHQVSDAIQPSHPLSSPSPPAFNLSEHQDLSNESALCIRWPKFWSFSFSISPSNEHPGLISFRMDWLDLDRRLKSRDITLPTKVCLVKATVFPVVMYGCESGLWRKQSAEELMLLNCGVGEDSWESLGLQGDPTSPFWRRSALGFLWKEWC